MGRAAGNKLDDDDDDDDNVQIFKNTESSLINSEH